MNVVKEFEGVRYVRENSDVTLDCEVVGGQPGYPTSVDMTLTCDNLTGGTDQSAARKSGRVRRQGVSCDCTATHESLCPITPAERFVIRAACE